MSLKWRIILPIGIVLFIGNVTMVGIVSWHYAASSTDAIEIFG